MKKKKNKTRIRNISILAALVIVVIVALKIASADDYADTREAVLAKYLSYEDASEVTYQDYLSGTGKTYVSDAAETLTVKASDYAETDMLECLYNNLVANQADVSICGIDRIGFGKYGDTWKDDFSCNVSGRQAVSCLIRRQPFSC